MQASAHEPQPLTQCFTAIARTKNLCINELETGRVGQNVNKLTDRQTYDLRVAAQPARTASPFIGFSLSPISESTHWSHLAQLMLGVAQWQAKGNQNQMGPGLGPFAEAAVGPCRSWLLSSGCPGRKECKSGYTGVVRHTAHRCAASHIVDWQRDSQQTQVPYPNVQRGVHRRWERPACLRYRLRGHSLLMKKDTSGKTDGVRGGQGRGGDNTSTSL